MPFEECGQIWFPCPFQISNRFPRDNPFEGRLVNQQPVEVLRFPFLRVKSPKGGRDFQPEPDGADLGPVHGNDVHPAALLSLMRGVGGRAADGDEPDAGQIPSVQLLRPSVGRRSTARRPTRTAVPCRGRR